MPRSIYEKSCRDILSEWLRSTLGPDGTTTRDNILAHMQKQWPKIKRTTVDCHIRKLTTNDTTRVHYSAGPQDDVLYREGSGQYRLYRPGQDPTPLYRKGDVPTPAPTDEGDEGGEEFAYEADLRGFLAKHLELIEPGLKLYDEEDITGVEFAAGNRHIDILAEDTNGNYVVIELKVSRGHERVVGQLAYYMAWVRQNLADGRTVRGIIVARDISDELKMAVSMLQEVMIYQYELKVTLSKLA